MNIVELVVVAGVHADVVLAAVTEAPAPARLVVEYGIAFEAPEMTDEALVVVRTTVSVARNTANGAELCVGQC